ncbi:MAG: hypothetical protein HOK52_04800 [Candidatus Marinimicrobia bacterium]|nr:hypothetical protein [Candidatus Neomarinimicrobiota bacterium]
MSEHMWNVPMELYEKTKTVSITFDNLTEQEAKAVVSWNDYWSSLWELDQWLRNECKHNDELTGDGYDAYDAVRDKIRSIMEDNNCSLEDLD